MLLDMSSTNLISPITNVPNRNNTSQVTYITSPPSGDPEEEKEIFTSSGQGGSNRHRLGVSKVTYCDISIIFENSGCVKTFFAKRVDNLLEISIERIPKALHAPNVSAYPSEFLPSGQKERLPHTNGVR